MHSHAWLHDASSKDVEITVTVRIKKSSNLTIGIKVGSEVLEVNNFLIVFQKLNKNISTELFAI